MSAPADESRPAPCRRIIWSITALYAIALFTATHLPPSEIPKVRVGDKYMHFIVYVPLGALLCASLWPTRLSLAAAALVAFGTAIGAGAIDELTQPLVGRFCSLDDWYADALGAACGVMIVTALRYLKPKLIRHRLRPDA